jgi:ArsR family transcriptional regulator, zinc-responsive transcriptional repressor
MHRGPTRDDDCFLIGRMIVMQESIGNKIADNGEMLQGGENRSRKPTPKYELPPIEHFQTVAFLAKSLSDENRLRILQLISSGKKSVSSIVEELNLSQPLVSHHLKELKRSLLVKIERNGPFIYYELVDPRILDVIQTLSTVATDLLTARKTF